MSETTELAVREGGALTTSMSIGELVWQVQLIQQALSEVMKKDEHYGIIPGTNKPTLFKPGAEKLCLLFRLAPAYEVVETWGEGGHYTVRATCRLTHIDSGAFVGSGEALCSTFESRYAYRKASRVCPKCGQPAIIKGSEQFGGGWVCWKKRDGCGAKFNDGDSAIEGQAEGRVANEDLPDTWNTVLKMASKRALVAAVLNATAASDIFTQDLEDVASTGHTAASEAKREVVSNDDLAVLRNFLTRAEEISPELWAESVVLANASRRFNREIKKLGDLSPEEAFAISEGARKAIDEAQAAADAHDQEVAEAEVVNIDPDGILKSVDDIPFGDDDRDNT